MITKHVQSEASNYKFSVLIPSWNNLPFLKNCLRALKLHSQLSIQPIVIINEGSDGTLQWLRAKGDIDYVHSSENIGVCYALNACRSLVKSSYMVYLNDDMYVLPGWDVALNGEIQRQPSKYFMLSGTMIEPHETGNPCVIVKNYGTCLDTFAEKELLGDIAELSKEDWSGSTWPPNVVHIDLWDMVGGLSVEFSPGMYSDPDFTRKLYHAGVRVFKGVGKSLVYHFGSKSTHRIKRNLGRKQYLRKWGHSANDFSKAMKSGQPFDGALDFDANKLPKTLKNIVKSKLS